VNQVLFMWVSILLNLKHNDFSWVIQFHFTATQSDRKISSCSCWQIYSIKFRSKSLHHSSWIKHYCTASQTPLKWKMLLLIILSVPGPKNASKADGWPILNGRAVTVCKMESISHVQLLQANSCPTKEHWSYMSIND